MRVSVLGCGNWGSVFAIIQCRNGHRVSLWEFDRARAQHIDRTRSNWPFLKNHKIPRAVKIQWDLEQAIAAADLVISALPAQVLRGVIIEITKFRKKHPPYLSLTKGIEIGSLKRPSEIINENLQPARGTFALAGPCIANEIIRGEPTAAVIVGSDETTVKILQRSLATNTFRIYAGNDIIGVELGGALKNVIALGCGISDGLGYGSNAKGALITRGIVEIQRVGVRMGAEPKTFWGLSGLGDLVTTSFSEESRNHKFGAYLGKGMSLSAARKKMVMVAEGVPTARAAVRLQEKCRVEMPICQVVYSILFKHTSPQQGIKKLMKRPLKNE